MAGTNTNTNEDREVLERSKQRSGYLGLIIGALVLTAYATKLAKVADREEGIDHAHAVATQTLIDGMYAKTFVEGDFDPAQLPQAFQLAAKTAAEKGEDVGQKFAGLAKDGGCINEKTPYQVCFFPKTK